MSFNEEYQKIKSLAKDETEIIEKIIAEDICVKQPLDAMLKNFLKAPAKRIRPVIAILLLKALGEKISYEQLTFLAVIEIIHNASLIHDDIIDECKLRRGHKTISEEFDNKLAVISGDYILSLAIKKLCTLNNVEIISEIAQTIEKMCIGEINQNFNLYKIGTIEEYIEKTQYKTAYLFACAIKGCLLLSSKNYNINHFTQIGLNIGTAFQIRDDIQNIISSSNNKPANNDIKQGIYNAPVILGDKKDNYASGIEKSVLLSDNYIAEAIRLADVLEDNIYKSALVNLAQIISKV